MSPSRSSSTPPDDEVLSDEQPSGGADGPMGLPRIRVGARPQHLLVTLFADYWFGREELLPSAALVALAEEFGITAASARASLSRLSSRGLLRFTKQGRRTFYGPTSRTEALMAPAQERIFSFGERGAQPWDGSWLVVAFSVPEFERDVRHALRRRLRWLGLAPLYDGVWVSAHPVEDEVRETIEACGIQQATIFRSTTIYSTVDSPPDRHPLSAWNLRDLGATYESFIARFDPVRHRVQNGEVGASEALVERTAIMDTWRSFPGLDPELPSSILPAGWPMEDAHRLFVQVYDALGPLAEARFRQILSRFDPELAALASHYTTDSALELAHRPDRAQ